MPIDEYGLGHDVIEGIKEALGLGANDWVGVAPNGDIITGDGNGEEQTEGNVQDHD